TQKKASASYGANADAVEQKVECDADALEEEGLLVGLAPVKQVGREHEVLDHRGDGPQVELGAEAPLTDADLQDLDDVAHADLLELLEAVGELLEDEVVSAE